MSMRSIFLIEAICVVITSCGTRKASSDNAEKDSLIVQEQKDSIVQSETLFDGDPNVSGSTENIGAIMKSIADGDTKTLAALAIYPIERRYPLHNIVSPSDMVKRFDLIFDQKFRNRSL